MEHGGETPWDGSIYFVTYPSFVVYVLMYGNGLNVARKGYPGHGAVDNVDQTDPTHLG